MIWKDVIYTLNVRSSSCIHFRLGQAKGFKLSSCSKVFGLKKKRWKRHLFKTILALRASEDLDYTWWVVQSHFHTLILSDRRGHWKQLSTFFGWFYSSYCNRTQNVMSSKWEKKQWMSKIKPKSAKIRKKGRLTDCYYTKAIYCPTIVDHADCPVPRHFLHSCQTIK